MPKQTFTLAELARRVDGTVRGDGNVVLHGVRPFNEAVAGDLTLASDPKYLARLGDTRASAVIVPLSVQDEGRNLLQVRNPRLAFAEVLRLFYVPPYHATGVHPLAVIGEGTMLGQDLSIAAHVVTGRNGRIGDRVTIHAGAVIGDEVQIGEDTVIYANVSIYDRVIIGARTIIHSGTVIGADGFGFVQTGGRHIKIPQVGNVIIGDDVEIGANCAIDRATLGSTIIGGGAKLDNFVQVGHNSVIGEHTLLVAQVGLSGSTTIGRHVTMAGQSATNQHVTIGDGAVIGGQAGVTKSVKPGAVVSGTPAMNIMEWKRAQVLVSRLPEIYERLRALEVDRLGTTSTEEKSEHAPGQDMEGESKGE